MMRRIKTIVRSIATAISLSIASASALAQQTIQVAYIDPLCVNINLSQLNLS